MDYCIETAQFLSNSHTAGGATRTDEKVALISLNPDLKESYGHFLHYENRMFHAANVQGISYFCLSNIEFNLDGFSHIYPVFKNDSGYYSLYRNSSLDQEEEIAVELLDVLCGFINARREYFSGFDKVIVFFYQGSVKLTYYISSVGRSVPFKLVVNG
jgi:hypothetical protein